MAAGRRWGKSYLAAVELIIEGLKEFNSEGQSVQMEEVYYVAPTFEQAKRIIWHVLKELGRDVIDSVHENTGTITLINRRRISIKGSDRPDTLRGVGLSFVVMDEYAFMKPEVWETIIQPALVKAKGRALFIGTPEGKNHFYHLCLKAQKSDPTEWNFFQFKSVDNPFLPREAIQALTENMSSVLYRQEMEASFESGGGLVFKEHWFRNMLEKEPEDGFWYIAVDPSGFLGETGASNSLLSRRDEHAIAIVKTHPDGWWVKDIDTGHWGVRETALRIIKHASDVKPMAIGIEKGSLKNAIMPYLTDEMNRLQRYFVLEDLIHGGKKKAERISWALQGRLEKGRVFFNPGEYHRRLMEQAADFPNELSRDDMLDALSYIDQLSSVNYSHFDGLDEWQPLDLTAGY